MLRTAAASLLLLAAAVSAQSLRFVQSGYQALEGAAARTPLGWSSSRMQNLADGEPGRGSEGLDSSGRPLREGARFRETSERQLRSMQR